MGNRRKGTGEGSSEASRQVPSSFWVGDVREVSNFLHELADNSQKKPLYGNGTTSSSVRDVPTSTFININVSCHSAQE